MPLPAQQPVGARPRKKLQNRLSRRAATQKVALQGHQLLLTISIGPAWSGHLVHKKRDAVMIA